MTTINGTINRVAPETVIGINGAVFRTHNGIRQYQYDKWQMRWNGNQFAPPEKDSVLYLPGVPGFGSTIFDYSGNGNHGTLTGATLKQNSQGLWYIHYDGVDDIVTIADATSIQNIFATGGTILTWINPRSDGEGDQGIIFEKGASNLKGWWLVVREEAGGFVKLRFLQQFAGGEGDWRTDNAVAPINTLSLVAVTYSASNFANEPILYLNNAIVASSRFGAEPTGAYVSDVGETLYIGNRAATDRTFDGGIPLPRLSTTILTLGQIANIYNQERHLFGV